MAIFSLLFETIYYATACVYLSGVDKLGGTEGTDVSISSQGH